MKTLEKQTKKNMLKVKIISKKCCGLEVGGEAGVAVNVQHRQWLSPWQRQTDDIISESCQITWTN